MNKKSIWVLVVFALLITLSVIAVFTNKGSVYKVVCAIRGGEYEFNQIRESHYCTPKNIFEAARKVLIGKVLAYPDDTSIEIVFTSEKDGILEGYLRNKEKEDRIDASVYADTSVISEVPNDKKTSFYMPFYIKKEGERISYFGLFSFHEWRGPLRTNNFFYKNAYLINSYAFKGNVVVDEIKQVRTGSYSNLFSVLVHDADAPQEERSIDLRYYYGLDRYEEHEGCVAPKKIISRQRGDGKSYDICLFETGTECALDAYEKGDCPYYGYHVSHIDDEMIKYGIIKGKLLKDGEFHFRGDDTNYKIEDFYYGRREFQD